MGNKRQRLARRRFSQTDSNAQHSNNEKLSSIESEKQPNTNTQKRKRVQPAENGLRNEGGNAGDNHARKKMKKELVSAGVSGERPQQKEKAHKWLSKHPLRVPGKKPGEGCFICKSTDHIARTCPQKSEKDRKKICLSCREVGHTLNNCPSKEHGQETKFCYNCGEVGHRLAECTKPMKNGGTTFAECFLCKQKGHLSKNCPSNTHGVYPKGGSCKICGVVTHLAKDCPQKGSGKSTNEGSGRMKLQISKEAAPAFQPGNNSKRIVFGSGDDLEDDFVELDGEEPTDVGGGADESFPGDGRDKLKQKDGKVQKGKVKKGKVELAVSRPFAKRSGKHTPKIINFLR